MTLERIQMLNNSQKNIMTRVWKNFSLDEKVLLKKSFQKCLEKEFSPILILGLINEKQEFVDTLLVPFKENVEIKTIEDLKREYPRAVRIGDAVVNFFKEIIMGMYEDTLTPGEIIYRCRKLGAKHMRARITFAADNWLSVKKVLVEAVLKLNGINEKSKLSSSQFLRKIKRAKSETKVGNVWRNFSEIVVKNMKSGFLDSASYGPEFVEKERILEVEDDTTKSFPISTSSDVLL